ncbi:putative fructosyl amino acid oxidase [Phaeomoniella chlamydospora]|uniref:Putative fructosyl amino acid oxidase n=1 Tax=Phaeomoniella chlamydospora TaxID=158046 RepID=A0A0G2G4S8_PHACM|nr:putative fructosyl amino acid oxidase [Phaeomoniella chlamydospora]
MDIAVGGAPSAQMERSILIVGGGTFGTSTAYHLSRRGYNSVTVLDRWAAPSSEAAGNDINKVIRADYPEQLYASLATEATEIWKDPNGMFGGLYHRCGWLIAASGISLPFIESSVETAGKLGFEQAQPMSPGAIHKRWPAFTGEMDGWKSYWNSSAGWADARTALSRMASATMEAGVKYISGDAGYVKQLLFDETSTCIGAKCADGNARFADVVIVAAGASAASVLDMKGQLVAKGHTVGHIQLSPEEVEKYKNIPIVDHLEEGILFPPQNDGVIKFGAVNFVTNYAKSHPDVSLPRYRSDNPNDDIPKPHEMQIRKWLKGIIPELADREWFETRICWDADMPDYNFLISPHPSHPNLKLAVGGSAHGFKFFPVIGKYIVDMLEDKLDPETAKKWRWRPGATLAESAPNPHPTPLKDLNEIPGWAETATAPTTAKS